MSTTNGTYRDCRFCQGRGCLACHAERDKEYARYFPDGPKLLATFRMDDANQAALAKELIGAPALEAHFGQNGDGINGLIEALRKAGKLEGV